MKILQLITLLVIASTAGILASCCSKDKNCPAGDGSLGTFPYAFNQQLVFADTAEHGITVQVSNGFIGSPQYTIDGSCSAMRKELDCEATLKLEDQTITDTDSAGLLKSNQRYFIAEINRNGNGNQTYYSLSAFGSVYFSIGDYGNSNIVSDAVKLSSYTTPSRTYSDVYANIPSDLPYNTTYMKKFVYTQQGKLISFSLNQDTTHIFYLVE